MTDHDHKVRLALVEQQILNIIDGMQLEKNAQDKVILRLTDKLDIFGEHLSRQDKMLYVGLGIVIALQFCTPFIFKLIAK